MACLIYNQDGSLTAVGRMDPDTGEFALLEEEHDFFRELFARLGIEDPSPPDQELYTSFDDPYLTDTYGSFGEDLSTVPDLSCTVEIDDIIDAEESSDDLSGVTLVEESDAVDAPYQETDTVTESLAFHEPDEMDSDEIAEDIIRDAAPEARIVELRDTGAGVAGDSWKRRTFPRKNRGMPNYS